MRYILSENLKKGMLLARNLYDENCQVAFSSEKAISNKDIDKIRKMSYSGVYILDAQSDQIVPEPFISSRLYHKIVRLVNSLLSQERVRVKSECLFPPAMQRELILEVLEELKSRPHILVDVIDLKPYAGYDCYHASMVMLLSLSVGLKMGLDETQLIDLGVGALLHDVGAVILPHSFLNRPGKLTDGEYEQMKLHVEEGAKYLSDFYEFSGNALAGVLQHHENYDGTGYPKGLKRKNISLYGRIIAVTDVYDAMVSKRSYRAAMLPVQAIDSIQQHSDRKFDPDIIEALSSIIAPYPTGILVKLRTGEVCLVAENRPSQLLRPKLVVFDEKRPSAQIIDLARDEKYAKVSIAKAAL